MTGWLGSSPHCILRAGFIIYGERPVSRRGIYGERLADVFHLQSAPAFVTRTLPKTEIAVTDIKCDVANNGFTKPIAAEDALLLQLQLAECPHYELWLDGRSVATQFLKAGVTCVYDLRSNPVAYGVSPFHSLIFYLPRRALDSIADIEGVSRVGSVNLDSGAVVDDPVIRGLGLSLLPAFEHSDDTDGLFVDHVTVAVAAHVLRAYGSAKVASSPRKGSRLARRQERLAKELLDSHIGGGLSLSQLAGECGLPISSLISGFLGATGALPHHWLLQRRLERAIDLMRNSRLSLVEIASTCGFADLRQFERVLIETTGVSSETWRRSKK